MINFSTITKAIETILREELSGYVIERNAARNQDPNIAARGKGWINISRGGVTYEAHTIGGNPWLASILPKIEIQTASLKNGEDAEDRLETAVAEVMDVLTDNKKLGNTVGTTLGYNVSYEYNSEEQVWHHAAIITIRAEARSG